MNDGHTSLRRWREKLDLTLKDAADLIGCSASALSHYEHRRKKPGRRIGERIRAVTGIATGSWDQEQQASAR